MKSQSNESKLMTTRIKRVDGTTVTLTYRKPEAARMRALVESLRMKGDRKPSLSLLARRSMGLYLDSLEQARQSNPSQFTQELQTLEQMTAPLCSKTTEKAAKASI